MKLKVADSPLVSPVATIWCAPTLSPAVLTPMLADPLALAVTVPSDTGVLCATKETFSPGSNPTAVQVNDPPATTTD